MKEATLIEIRNYFGMDSTQFTKEWKELDGDTRIYFRIAVGEEIHGGE